MPNPIARPGPGMAGAAADLNALRRFGPLLAGLALLAALWFGPLPGMSRTAFSLHMVLHLGIVVAAAPLLAWAAILAGLRLSESPRLWCWVWLASAAEMIVVWGWHLPLLHEAAARNGSVFVLQQASFLLAGIAVWWVAFADTSRQGAAAGALAMLLTFVHMTMLGVLLVLSRDLLYAPDLCRGAFGFAQLEDQQLGGSLMASVGGLPYLCAGLALIYRTLDERTGMAG